MIIRELRQQNKQLQEQLQLNARQQLALTTSTQGVVITAAPEEKKHKHHKDKKEKKHKKDKKEGESKVEDKGKAPEDNKKEEKKSS